jgi:uncharacterized protein (TIGR03437 family)
VIYGAGLGAVVPSDNASDSPGVVSTPVSVVINGIELVPAFAGLSPGTAGVYQVKVQLPESLPPGLTLPLYLSQGGVTSNTVTVAIQ